MNQLANPLVGRLLVMTNRDNFDTKIRESINFMSVCICDIRNSLKRGHFYTQTVSPMCESCFACVV